MLIEVANFIIHTIIAFIQEKLIKDKFNNGYKIYKCLKKLL